MDRLKAIFISHSHHDHVMDMPLVGNRYNAAVYGSKSALNVARGGNVPEAKLVEFQADKTYTIGNYKIQVLNSLHSKPTILNNDLGQTIDKPLVQPAKLRNYKEGGSYDFYHFGKSTTPDQLDQPWVNCLYLFDAEYTV